MPSCGQVDRLGVGAQRRREAERRDGRGLRPLDSVFDARPRATSFTNSACGRQVAASVHFRSVGGYRRLGFDGATVPKTAGWSCFTMSRQLERKPSARPSARACRNSFANMTEAMTAAGPGPMRRSCCGSIAQRWTTSNRRSRTTLPPTTSRYVNRPGRSALEKHEAPALKQKRRGENFRSGWVL